MSPALDVSINVLYVQGTRIDEDRTATDELRAASAELQITTIAGPAAALAELRRTPGWQALITSPTVPQNETLALVASIRRDRIPIAIVPIIDDSHQELFAAAVAAGADDVLVRREGGLVSIRESLTRIRQSPHLFPAEQRRRIAVLYAGRDPLVWNLLAQVPFIRADRATVTPEGTCSVRRPGAGDDSLRADAVIVDEAPGDAHPLQVLKSVKAQASDMPVIVLTSAAGADVATAALELGADDTVLKTGIFRRRLIATLRRVHQRIEVGAQQQETRAREERLRQIVENVPTGIMVVSGDGRVLAMNAAALQLFGATRPRDVVGRDFRELAAETDRTGIAELLRQVTKGDPGALDFRGVTLAGESFAAHLDAVMLERDARGNRGLVVAVSRAGQPAEAVAELPGLRAELERLERHYAELEDARARERAAWETERQQLVTKVETAERLAAERDTLARRLEDVTAELTRAGSTFASEREALEHQIRELEVSAAQASDAGARRAELERTLTQVRADLQETVAAHAVERSGWDAIRSELETRVQQLDRMHQSEHDTLVASLRQELQQFETTLAEERSRWTDARTQLETELRDAREALWQEHRKHDATRAELEAELAGLRRQFEEARAAWQGQEASLQHEIADLRSRTETLTADWNQERTGWATERAALTSAHERAAAALDVERAAWREEREAIDAERQRLAERLAEIDAHGGRGRIDELEHERERWLQDRASLEQQLREGRDERERIDEALRALADEYDATRARLERERDEARAAADIATHAVTELEARHVALEAELTSLGRHAEVASALEARLATVEQERDTARANAERAAGSAAALETQLTSLQADMAEARAKAEAAAHALELAREDHDASLSALLREQDEMRTALEQRVAELEQLLARGREAQARAEAEWRDRREADERQAAEALLRAEQERTRLVTLHTREQEEWRQAIERARAERDRLTSHAAEIEASLADERRRIAAVEAASVADRARTEELESALQTARLESEAARHQLADLEAALASARAALEEASETLDATRRELRHTDATHQAERERWQAEAAARNDERMAIEARHAAEHEAWDRERAELEAEAAELARLRSELQHLHETVAEVRRQHDALAGELDRERSTRERERGERDELRLALDTTEQRIAEARAEADQAARGALQALEQERTAQQGRLRELEDERRRLTARLGDQASEADAARSALQARYDEAARARARLIGMDAFAYALTSGAGELLSCNDAFARLFGYVNAPDALVRTSGRPFPGLAGRQTVDARLREDGRADHVVSCIERIDGKPVRILEWATVVPSAAGGPDAATIEHVILSGPAGPSDEEQQARRLQEVGALTTAMMPELESLVGSLRDRLSALDVATLSPAEFVNVKNLTGQARALVQQLAAFSRRQTRGGESIDLRDVVTAAEPVLIRLAGDYVAFSTSLSAVTAFRAHRDDVDQLITSLVTRGRDLLPAGGSLVVDVRQLTGPDDQGPVVAVSVSGYGVQEPGPSPTLEQLAQRCGGLLRVTTEAGWNVRLEVLFPRCPPARATGWGWMHD